MKKFSYLLILFLVPLLGFSQQVQETVTEERINGEAVSVVRTTIESNQEVNSERITQTVEGERVSPNARASEAFRSYDLYRINFSELKSTARSNEIFEVTMNLGEEHQWNLLLEVNDMRTDNYQEIIGTENGFVYNERRPAISFKGYSNNPDALGEMIRLNIADSFVNGFVTVNEQEYFIEPLQVTDRDAAADLFVVYRPEDVIDDGNHECTYTAAREEQHRHEGQSHFEENSRMMSCLVAELGTACTWDFVEIQGTTTDANDRIIAITNLVEGLYSPFMIEFDIVGQFAPASAMADPFTASDEAFTILNSMQAWAPANLPTHDVGQIWTGRDIQGCGGSGNFGLIGCAQDIGDVCGEERYNVCENWNGNTNCLRTLSAHEFGHTFDGVHSQSAAGSIMTPSINCNATTFTAGNTTRMQNHIDSRDCLAACCPLTVNCALITDQTLSCRADLPPVDFDLPIIVESCGDVTLSALTIIPGNSGCPGDEVSITRTYFIQDEEGNMEQCMQTFTVISNQAPTIVCPANMIVECAADISVSAVDAVTTVECGTPSVSLSGPVITGTANCDGAVYTYTYTVTDFCNRMASCTQTFTLNNAGTTLTIPPNVVVECGESTDPADTGMATATEACGNGVDITSNDVSNVTTCDGGTIVRTWTATDDCGRVTSQDQTILVNAPDAPEITTCPANATVTCEEDVIPVTADLEADVDCDLAAEVTVSDPVVVGEPGCDGTTYTFTYTITDECGRTDECMQTFTLDNNAPTVTVPADATVECAADIEVSTDDMTVVQDCPGELILSVNGPIIDGPENCPGTTYTFIYRAIDDCGRVSEAERVFTIGNNDAPTIMAPVDLTCTCLAGINPNPDYATFTTACDNGVEAEVTVSGPQIIGALDCPGTRYIYTYTVTDACGRSASDTQTYTVENDGPELTCPAPLQVFGCLEGGYNDKIEAWIETVEASSSCGLDLSVSNNFNGNAGICLGNNFTTVTFSAVDACGRSASCQGTIAITDTDAPIIYVEPQELLVPCTGNTQQIFNDWLTTQGGAQATDACWGDQVNWSASVGPNALNCANGPQAIVVTFTATDGCGNAATTVGIFNTKLLPNQVNVNGLIMREDNEPVADVQVGAYLGGGIPQMDMSDSAGDYAFPELEYDEDTEIKPEKNDDPLNGISTFDLVLMQQHILAINSLNSPYKKIAADINRSGNISTLDLVLLRRLILQIDEEFTDNTSWRFVDADFVFPNPQNPFATEFPEIYNATGQEEEEADFIAVKIGDLNLDGDTYGLMGGESDDRSDLDVLHFNAKDKAVQAGGTYQIDFNASNFDRINGFQFTLNFDQELIEVLHVEAGDLVNFDEKNFNLAKRENGAIPMSWNMDVAQDLRAEDVAFSVIVKANSDTQLSEVLTISSQYTRAEAYQNTELMNVDLIFNSELQAIASSKFKLFQNVPNPFMAATTIGFNLPEASEVTLEVFDVSGRILVSETGTFTKGFNQFDVERKGLPVGVLYYKVTTADRSASKKMILME